MSKVVVSPTTKELEAVLGVKWDGATTGEGLIGFSSHLSEQEFLI